MDGDWPERRARLPAEMHHGSVIYPAPIVLHFKSMSHHVTLCHVCKARFELGSPSPAGGSPIRLKFHVFLRDILHLDVRNRMLS